MVEDLAAKAPPNWNPSSRLRRSSPPTPRPFHHRPDGRPRTPGRCISSTRPSWPWSRSCAATPRSGRRETLFATATRWGKTPVRARSTPGFIVNRVARPFYAEALALLEEGAADPATVDAVLRDMGGFRMGPFELMDLIGHDVNFAVTSAVFEGFGRDPRFAPSRAQRPGRRRPARAQKRPGLCDYNRGPAARARICRRPCPRPRRYRGDPSCQSRRRHRRRQNPVRPQGGRRRTHKPTARS